MAEEEQTFSPAEICAWFDIPRTTLFRWEDDGRIRRTERRGPRAERVYRREHLTDLLRVVRDQMEHEIDLAQRHDPYAAFPSPALLERLCLVELFAGDNPRHALRQLRGLAQKHELKTETLHKIIEFVLKRPRGDPLRRETWQFLLEYEQRARP